MANKNFGTMVNEAGNRARARDREREKVLTDEEMDTANQLAAKADANGMKLVPKKKHNNTKFVQIIQPNWAYLQEKKYLSSEDIVFLMSLVPYIGLHSNALVDNPRKKQPLAMNQTELAKALGTSKTKVSRVIKNLVEKGIIARSESGLEDNNAKAFALFVNPHILFRGDRDNIEEGLKIQFQKPMKMKVLKDLPERFF